MGIRPRIHNQKPRELDFENDISNSKLQNLSHHNGLNTLREYFLLRKETMPSMIALASSMMMNKFKNGSQDEFEALKDE